MTQFQLTIHVDDYATDLDPFDRGDPLFKFHSFNQNDTHYTHPDEMVCAKCSAVYLDHSDEGEPDEDEELCNDFTYPEGYWLSHYEHGARHWSIQGTVNYPDMQWDGVRTAGYLEVVVPKDEREWWNGRSEDDRLEAAKATIEEYTSWINGEVYGYSLVDVREEQCDKGFTHTYEGENVDDGCFGLIGWDWLQAEVQGSTTHEGATAENTKVIDKAHGMVDYGTFFKTEVSA